MFSLTVNFKTNEQSGNTSMVCALGYMLEPLSRNQIKLVIAVAFIAVAHCKRRCDIVHWTQHQFGCATLHAKWKEFARRITLPCLLWHETPRIPDHHDLQALRVQRASLLQCLHIPYECDTLRLVRVLGYKIREKQIVPHGLYGSPYK